MKIGILTHHYINNFGAFLQAYALQETIKRLRPKDEVYMIDYINFNHYIINTCGWLRFYRKESIAEWKQKIKIPVSFAKSRTKYFNLSERVYTAKKVDKLDFDYIIVGSDEVWNYKDAKGNSRIKFGEGLSCKKLVAYAPSVGKTKSDIVPDYVIEGIKRFKAVSARDELTEKLASQIRQEEIVRVVDPTFLYNIPDEPVGVVNEPYILFYYCDGLSDNEKDKIIKYAKEKGLKVYGAGECDRRYSDITVNLTPFQWVWMFRNAEYVVTGTFHGAVFSMLNHRQFACYLTNPSRVEKVGSLLQEFGLGDRRANGTAEEIINVLEKTIEYKEIESIFNEKREQSLRYLEKALDINHELIQIIMKDIASESIA